MHIVKEETTAKPIQSKNAFVQMLAARFKFSLKELHVLITDLESIFATGQKMINKADAALPEKAGAANDLQYVFNLAQTIKGTFKTRYFKLFINVNLTGETIQEIEVSELNKEGFTKLTKELKHRKPTV